MWLFEAYMRTWASLVAQWWRIRLPVQETCSFPGLGRSPREGNGWPTQEFLPGKSHGQRYLVGSSPWGYRRVGYNLVTAAGAAKSHQSCPTLCDPIDSGPPGSLPWDSPGKHTGVGCHFLLQCMKVKGESEVAQSCLTLRDPMDCSLPGSSIHGISQARVLEWGAIAFSSLVTKHQ